MEGFTSMEDFRNVLSNNQGIVLIKFGAQWCSPCKKIEPHVKEWFKKLPNYIQTIVADIDECIDIYGFLKTKRMISGVPTILMFKKGNLGYIFDDCVSGSDPLQYDLFFKRCLLSKLL